MRVQLMTAIAVCLAVSACSDSKAPDISLDSKLKCSLVAEAKMQGDNGTVIRLVNSAFEAASADYKGDSDIEYYFQYVVRTEPLAMNSLQRAVMNHCIADTGASISGTFRDALNESYERNAGKISFASCKAFNDGKFSMEQLRPHLAQTENNQLQMGPSAVGLNLDSSNPKWDIYEEAIKTECKANPSKRLDNVIGSAVFNRLDDERKIRQTAAIEANTKYRAETTQIISQMDALIKNNQPVQCVMLKRIDEDKRNYDNTQSEIYEALSRAHEATFARHSLLYAAAVRRQINFSTLNYNICASEGLTFDQSVEKEFGPDTRENVARLLEGRSNLEDIAAEELDARNKAQGLPPAARAVQQDLGAELDEGEEMQMNRASRADMEDALYQERQAQEQSN